MKPVEGGIATGTVLVGKYRVESVVGQGGMGMVYKAHHLQLDEPVAIKVLRRDVMVDQDTLHRFVREAQAAAKLKSEHVAHVSDVGTFEDDLPYMVMELLDGSDLGAILDQHGAMITPVAVDLVLQACDALAEAHSHGIVHRDIKPSNLFVAARPDQSAVVKVLDFGISKSATGADLSLTQTSSMLGTPAYMSPEQMRSARTVDARTDIWSLGTVLYELVEGRQPFEAESFSEMCVKVAIDPPAPLIHAPELEPIFARCLAKRPEDRYASVAELAHDLARFAGNPEAARHYVVRTHRVLGLPVPTTLESSPAIPRPARDSAPVIPYATAAPTHASSYEATAPVRLSGRRGAWLPALIALAVAVAGGFAVFAVTRDRDAEPAPAGTAAGSAPAIAPEPATPDAAVTREATVAPDAGLQPDEPAPPDQGSAAGTVAREPTRATKPPVKPPARKPPARKPPIKKPPPRVEEPAKPPVQPQKKCDPFATRTKC